MRSVALFLLLTILCSEASMVSMTKKISNFVWDLKNKIPDHVKERAVTIFGGVSTAYNIKWMWDVTFASDPFTKRDEKVKGILMNKLEGDSSISIENMRKYRKQIMAAGEEIYVVYSHCVENRWFHQSTCIARDIEEIIHDNRAL